MWWLLWTVLAIGTLVGAFFLGRWLWRKAVELGREAARASEALARLSERADELAEESRARHPVPPPALARDPAELRADLTAAQERRDQRKDQRTQRHRLTWDEWAQHWS